MITSIVELKAERKVLKARYAEFAKILFTRDMTDDESADKDDTEAKIASLDKRIAALEAMEKNSADDEEDIPEKDESGSEDEKDETSPERSKARNSIRHLEFNPQTSKTRKESHKYSIHRALVLALHGQRVDGLEGEHSQEIARERGNPQGFYLPWDAPLQGRHRMEKRDFTTSTGTGAVGINVQSTLIDLLRAKLAFDKLGGTIMTNCKGKFALPRQNTASSYYFVGEGSNVTTSNPVLDQVNFVPQTMGIRVLTSRKNMIESSIDALTLVEQDVMKSLKVGLEKTIFNGSGGAPTPTGILQNSGVGTVTLVNDAGNGADLTYQDVLNFESTVANANAEAGSLGFLTTPGVRAKLKQTPKNGSGYPEFIWETGDTIIGHMAETTTNMPSGLTKGTNSNLHSVIYGNWEDAVLALWTGIDVFLDPYTSGAAGAVIFQAFQEVDVELLHGGSFCVSSAVSIA